ncbi:RnfABCDGE type electron transport complex subunit B [Leeia sp. TBRC 13508]|uniref:RnfABCDGE type electron transport complex subunit B n=1 Tax=Leeia speluncae TaxID=2884804 RepID=A0ABS8D8K6_9NEIS|nr:RnfABCDGE type electron transport complex subunit B [Leeia speluncae]MCB6184348.1 RnfABCDGE type electron transport complex subunit B [Leeia speluncae]
MNQERRDMLFTIEDIDALLPQTQCRQCGYQGCLPYAEAIVNEGAAINRCPPGGEEGLNRLAMLTGQTGLTLDKSCGETKPLFIAKVDEANCIGCTLCIQACPVDAIIGAAKHMHTILADRCTGCELCLPPCPTECIEMLPVVAVEQDYPAPLGSAKSSLARKAYRQRQTRLARDKAERTQRLASKTTASAEDAQVSNQKAVDPKMAAILAAMERAKQQLAKK